MASIEPNLKQITLDRYVREYVRKMERGEKVLFVFRAMREGKGEFVHFHLLLQDAVYSAMVIEDIDSKLLVEFTPPCIVWLHLDQKAKIYRITEATCLDERAKYENDLAIKKLDEFQSMLDLPFTQGKSRTQWIPPTSKQSKPD